jgi:hypothetical protein
VVGEELADPAAHYMGVRGCMCRRSAKVVMCAGVGVFPKPVAGRRFYCWSRTEIHLSIRVFFVQVKTRRFETLLLLPPTVAVRLANPNVVPG